MFVGDGHRGHVSFDVRVRDARVAQAPRQRDGRARSLRLRPATQLETRRQRTPLLDGILLLIRY